MNNYRKLSNQELIILSNFLTSLKTDDVELFYSCLSTNCKEAIKHSLDDDFDNNDILFLLKETKNNFGDSLEFLGIGNIIHFTNEEKTKGKATFPTNVKTEIYIFQDSEVEGFYIPMDLEEDIFKVNIFVDK